MPSKKARGRFATLETTLRAHAMRLPESEEAFPWGERAIKVRGKAFLFMRGEEKELSFSVKLPKTGVQALALPFAEPTGYGLGRAGWVTVRVQRPSKAIEAQCKDWIDESYAAVAPMKLVKAMSDEP